MPTNYLTQFATSGTANLPTESTWQNLTERATGFQTGLARSSYFNRLFAQGANAAYVLGQFVVDYASQNANLNGATLYTNFKTALNTFGATGFTSLSAGNTVTTNNWIQRNGTASNLRISGGGSYSTGGNIQLFGETSYYHGAAFIWASDGENSVSLRTHPSGSIEINGTSNHVAFGKGTYTVTNIRASGYLTGGGTSMVLYVPLQVVGTIAADDLTELKATVRVGTGGYTSPGSTSESIIPSEVSKTVSVRDGAVNLTLTRSAGWGQPTNTTVIAQISSITFTVS